MYIVDDSDLMVKTNNLDDLESSILKKFQLFFILETLGLNQDIIEIIEIGAVRLKFLSNIERFVIQLSHPKKNLLCLRHH